MFKFILPAAFKQVQRKPVSSPLLWPNGTPYYHEISNTYFRFLKLGNRWEPAYGISTSSGVLSLKRVDGKIVTYLNAGPRENAVTNKDKNILCEILLSII